MCRKIGWRMAHSCLVRAGPGLDVVEEEAGMRLRLKGDSTDAVSDAFCYLAPGATRPARPGRAVWCSVWPVLSSAGHAHSSGNRVWRQAPVFGVTVEGGPPCQ